MRAKALFIGLLLVAVLFIDYIILTLTGCIADACSASDSFYCTVFCKIVIFLVVGTSLLPFVIAAFKAYYKN